MTDMPSRRCLRSLATAGFGLLSVLAGCAPQSTPAPKPAASGTSGGKTALEQELATNSPFAGLPTYEKPTAVSSSAPTTKVGQRALLNDPTWQAAVDKAHQGLEALVNAGRLRDSEDPAWREETQRGKALLSEALDDSYAHEAALENDPARANTHRAVLQTRSAWNKKLREAGKLVRG
jgi:hypothetical protein